MSLTTSSAGAIIISTQLTESAVTGCYKAHHGILRNKISSQQTTWIELEDCNSTMVVLEDGNGTATLGGSIWRRFNIAAVVLSGSSRRTCGDSIGVSNVKAEGLLLQRLHHRQQGRQERTCPMQGTYVGSNGIEIGILRRRLWWQQGGYDNSLKVARVRGQWRRTSTGKARGMPRV